MYDRRCADTARSKISAYASLFWGEVQSIYAAEDYDAILAVFAIMRGRVGTKSPYAFLEVPEKYRDIVVNFWTPSVAAYAFCMEEQQHIVAGVILQTLDRFAVLLEREGG